MLQRSIGDPSSNSNLSETALKRRLLNVMGYKVLLEINEASVIMPTALVGTVLLTLSGRSVGRSELLRRVLWLTERVRNAGGRVAHFAESTVEGVVDKALGVLGPQLVGRLDDLAEEMYYAEDRFQLSFYRNMTIHLFISQALICASMYIKVKLGGGSDKEQMSYKELYDYTYFLSQLFRAEFIFPTTPFEENLQTTLASLVKDKVLSTTTDSTGQISTISIHPDERALDLENFDFYNFLLWPFIEASWLGNIAIFMLAPPSSHTFSLTTQSSETAEQTTWIDLKTFQDAAQLLGKTLYHRGDLVYYEAVNKESLKNAISRSEEEGIILITKPTKDSKSPQRVRLNPDWMPRSNSDGDLVPEGRLWEFCEYINLSRRDGEGKKEGRTVTKRILGLARVLGQELFEQAVSEKKGVQTTKIRRRQGIKTGGRESRL